MKIPEKNSITIRDPKVDFIIKKYLNIFLKFSCMGKKVYISKSQIDVYNKLVSLYERGMNEVTLSTLSSLLKKRNVDIYRSLIYLKIKGIVDFEDIKDNRRLQTYKIKINNIKQIRILKGWGNQFIVEVL